MLKKSVFCQFSAHVFVIAFCFTTSSCIPQKRPEVPKSEVNNSALRTAATSGLNLLLEYTQRTGSTAALVESATLVTPFVKNPNPAKQNAPTAEQSAEWKSDAEWLGNTSSNVTCSAWFDSLLIGDQATTRAAKSKNEKYLLQFKICRSPAEKDSESKWSWLSSVWQKCVGLVKDGRATWNVYRTLPIQAHALVASSPQMQECSAWDRNISFINLMGPIIHYSFTRSCRLRCEQNMAQKSAGVLNWLSQACASTRETIEWTEFAEYPDQELTAKTESQGAASCTLEPVKP